MPTMTGDWFSTGKTRVYSRDTCWFTSYLVSPYFLIFIFTPLPIHYYIRTQRIRVKGYISFLETIKKKKLKNICALQNLFI